LTNERAEHRMPGMIGNDDAPGDRKGPANRVLIVAYYYPPIQNAGTHRPQKLKKYLPRKGIATMVLTSSYSGDSLDEPAIIRIHDRSFNKKREGIRYWRWLAMRLYTEMLNRCGRYHSIYSTWKNRAVSRADWIVQHARPNVIIASYPPVESLEIGLVLARKLSIPLISDFRDGLLFEPIEGKRLARYRCVTRRYREIEAEIVSHSRAVLTVCDPLTRYFQELYSHPRVFTIANGFDPDDFKQLPSEPILASGCFHIVHTGRFGLSDPGVDSAPFFQAIEMLLKVQPALAATLRIDLIGEYNKREKLEYNRLRESGVVIDHGVLTRDACLAVQRQADLLLIISQPERSSVVSLKIFEYLQAGRPILALTHRTGIAEIVRNTGTGWVVHSGDCGAIADLLTRIITDKRFYRSLQPHPEEIDQYNVMRSVDRLVDIVTEIK